VNLQKKIGILMNLKSIIYKKKHPEKVRARDIAKYRIKIPQGQICVFM